MALKTGDILQERYRILAVLGQGGMGSVYKASDITLEITVAIKENLFGSAEYAEQFKQEAHLLASLRHPNLPRVTDYFVIENQGQYLVMDYIEGEDLKERIEREGAISPQEAAIIGLALCDALEYLHSQKPPVVHRDIKPGNVRITPEGHVFLVDFGLAKIGGHDQRTVTGAQAVTPGFSPPEQYGTAHTAPHSDIYSLGATLYMALAGEAPPDAFERALDQAELRPLDEVNPKVPAALARLIETAMALQPSERFASAAEMRSALLSLGLAPDQERHLQDHEWTIAPPPQMDGWRVPAEALPEDIDEETPPPASSPPSKPPTHPKNEPAPSTPRPGARRSSLARRLRIWLLFLLIAAVVGGWYRLSPQTFDATAQRTWQWSQAHLVPVVNQWLPRLHLSSLLAASPTPTASPAPPTAAPSPSLTTVASVPTTAPPTPSPSPTPSFTPSPTPTPSPQPSSTATPTLSLAATNATTTTPAATPTATPSPGPTPMGGSDQIAFASLQGQTAQIWLANTQGKIIKQLTNLPSGACQPAWAADGKSLAFISPCKGNQQEYTNTQIYQLDIATGQSKELTVPEWGGYDPAFSPDGRYLAFTSRRTGKPKIYVLNLQTRQITALAPKMGRTAQPAWSPDGRWLAFTSLDTQRIWIVPFDPEKGTPGEPEAFSHSGAKSDAYPAWAGAGALLVFNQTSAESPLSYLVKAPLDQKGLQEFPLTVVGMAMRKPVSSPDGRWLAFEGWKDPNHDIYLISIDGAQVKRLTTQAALDFDPAWRPARP